MKGIKLERKLQIVDMGCGDGDMLRTVAKFARKHKIPVTLLGVDANANTIQYAEEKSVLYPEIKYQQIDVFSEAFANLDYDIVLSTLFLHHFREEEILELMSSLVKKARFGIIINDLHRSTLAYYLFRLLCIFITNPMVRNDGSTSILRGFRKPELKQFAKELSLKNSSIQWKWAFRFQWVIKTI